MHSVLKHPVIVLLQQTFHQYYVSAYFSHAFLGLIDRIIVGKIVNTKFISKNPTFFKLTLSYILICNILDKQVYGQEMSIQLTIYSGEEAAYRVKQHMHLESLQSQFDVAVFLR